MTGRPGGRLAAVLGAAAALTHLLLAGDGGAWVGTAWVSAGMAVLALACLPCAVHLWRRPTGRVWAASAAVDLGMLGLHLPLLVDGAGRHGGHGTGTVLLSIGLALAGGQLMLSLGTLLGGWAAGGVRQIPAGVRQGRMRA